MLKKMISAGMIFSGMMAILTISANAYLDPSVISYVIQGIGVVVVAGGAAITIYWKKIKLAFKRRKEKKNAEKQIIQKPDA